MAIAAPPEIASSPSHGLRARAWTAAYLAFIGVHTLLFAWLMARDRASFIVGDWLINYSGGFVRRGLTGALLLPLAGVTHLPLQWCAFAMQSAAFLVLLVCMGHLVRRMRWTPLTVAVLLSPAGIGFTVTDSFAGLRKEVLLFAALALFLCLLERASAHPHILADWVLSATLALMLTTITLAHEALIVCAPYFVAALALFLPQWRRILRICAAPALCAALALVAVALHPGNLRIAQTVCSSLGQTLLPWDAPHDNLCSGSVAWLSLTLPQARAIFVPVLQRDHFLRFYLLIAPLVFGPLVAAFLLLWRRGGIRHQLRVTLCCCAALSLVGTLLLCYTAMDWGRWLHMQVMCLTLLLLVLVQHAAPIPAPPRPRWLRGGLILAVAAYALLWTLPSIYPRRGLGYIDLARGWAHTLHHLHDPSSPGFLGAPQTVTVAPAKPTPRSHPAAR